MASDKYNYFVAFYVFSSTGKPLTVKNGYILREQLVVTRDDVVKMENDLKDLFALENEQLILMSFTQLTGGETN